jgi:hypothetical protein
LPSISQAIDYHVDASMKGLLLEKFEHSDPKTTEIMDKLYKKDPWLK